MRLSIAFAIFLFINISSAMSSEEPLSFQRDIQPIFDTNCVACHQTGSAQAGLILEDGMALGALLERPSTEVPLKLVSAGSPEASYLLYKLTGQQSLMGGKGERMPLGGKLDVTSIARIRLWIKQGANQN